MTYFGILSLRPQFEQRMVPTGKGGGRGGGGAGGEGAGVEGAGGKGAGGPADATNPLPQTPKSKKRKKTVNDDDDGDSDGDYQAPGTPKKPRRQRASKRLASNAKVVNPDDEDEFVQIQSPIPRKRAAGEDSSETEGAPAQPPRKRPARIAAAAKKPPSRRKNATQDAAEEEDKDDEEEDTAAGQATQKPDDARRYNAEWQGFRKN